MPSFDFSLVKKESNKRKTSNNINKYDVVEKNVIGVVHIDINANYYVKINDRYYNINSECYSCKGKNMIYAQGYDDKRRICIIHSPGEYTECNHNLYLPFAPGCIVSGDIIINHPLTAKIFNIKKVWIDFNNDDAHEALAFYKEHYKEINAIILKRRFNET